MSIAIIDVTGPGEPVDGYSSWIRYATGVGFYSERQTTSVPLPARCADQSS